MEQGYTYIKISPTCKTAQAWTYRHSFPPRGSGGQTWRHTCCRRSSVWSVVDAGSDRWCKTGGGAGSQTQQAPEYPAHRESTLSQSLTQPLMFINMSMFCICFVCIYVAQIHLPWSKAWGDGQLDPLINHRSFSYLDFLCAVSPDESRVRFPSLIKVVCEEQRDGPKHNILHDAGFHQWGRVKANEQLVYMPLSTLIRSHCDRISLCQRSFADLDGPRTKCTYLWQ